MIRDETIDTGKPIRPDGGSADVSGIGHKRVTHYFSSPPRPLWNECVRCHRKGTLVETPPTGDDEKAWKCRKCGDVNPSGEIHAYFDDVMDNEVNMPECPPIMMAAMLKSADTLFRYSRGEPLSRVEAGNIARLLIRRVEHYGVEQEEWFDDAVE